MRTTVECELISILYYFERRKSSKDYLLTNLSELTSQPRENHELVE